MSKNAKPHKYLVEVLEEKPKCLLVFQKANRFITRLSEKLNQTHALYESSLLDSSWQDFDLVVFLGVVPEDFSSLRGVKKCYFIFFNQLELYQTTRTWLKKHLKQYKVINLGHSKKTITELVDYVLYRTPTPYYFNLAERVIPKPFIPVPTDPKKSLWLSLRILFWGIITANLIFLFFFLGEWLLLFNLSRTNRQDFVSLQKQIVLLDQGRVINDNLKNIPKNTLFWLPGIESFLGFVDTTNTSVKTLALGVDLLNEVGVISHLTASKNKTPAEVAEIKLRLERFDNLLNDFSARYYETISLWQKTNIPFFNRKKQQELDRLRKVEEYLATAQKISPQLPALLGAEKPRKYLLLFMNNMELRPGGGFLGSLAMVQFDQYSLKDLKVYDVYTLDGQLRAHVDPPTAIRKHLNQPHWFLRDSNFSPDFSVNSQEALKFIKSEVGWTDFDGVVGLTLSSVQKALSLFPNFYLADYNENITPDNFFLKAQTYAEKNFFPGSHKKKDFLQSVFQTLILKLEEGDYETWRLGLFLRDIFEEKQAALYFPDPKFQVLFDELFWTGRVVTLECNFQKNCFSDYVYVVDANLGVNKTNFYIQRTMRLTTTINTDRTVSNSLVVDYYNQSIPEVFPGGNYKNYVQVYLPKNTYLQQILVEGEPVVDYDLETVGDQRKVGLLFNVLPGSKTNLVLKYDFTDRFLKQSQYQLIVQKQIGSVNNDLVWEMRLPSTLALKQSNFTPFVRSGSFVYNTFLQKDRILIVDFK